MALAMLFHKVRGHNREATTTSHPSRLAHTYPMRCTQDIPIPRWEVFQMQGECERHISFTPTITRSACRRDRLSFRTRCRHLFASQTGHSLARALYHRCLPYRHPLGLQRPSASQVCRSTIRDDAPAEALTRRPYRHICVVLLENQNSRITQCGLAIYPRQ